MKKKKIIILIILIIIITVAGVAFVVIKNNSEKKDETSRNGVSPGGCDQFIKFTPATTPFTYIFLLLSDGVNETYPGTDDKSFKKAHKILKIEERQTFYPGEAEKFLPPEHRET